jgi:hypothetical protein
LSWFWEPPGTGSWAQRKQKIGSRENTPNGSLRPWVSEYPTERAITTASRKTETLP